MTKQIRNAKSELRNRREIQNSKVGNAHRHTKALFEILNSCHSDLFRVSISGFRIFSISSFSCGQQACCHRGPEIVPSNKPAFLVCPDRKSRLALSAWRSSRRCHRLRTPRLSLLATVSNPDGNQHRWWLGRDRTRPNSLP